MRLLKASFALTLAAATLAAADASYVGKWKLNPAKSDFGSTTITYAQLPSGEMQATVDGQSYKFKMDGKDYPDPFGDTAAWKSIDAGSWQTTWKVNGKVTWTDSVKLSADGKALTVESTGTKPNGDKMDDTSTFQRVSGGPGLAGKWKTQKFNSSAPSVFEFAPSGSNGLTLREIDVNMTCDAKTDGKDYACSGPTMGPGWTVAYTKADARVLELAVKKDGKLLYKFSYAASADGKTLTATGGAAATNEKVKIIYDRQ
jgi:hypothetical protein